jgi:transposase
MKQCVFDHKEIYKAHLSGMSYPQISKQFKCSEHTVYRAVRKNQDPERFKDYAAVATRKHRSKINLIAKLEATVNQLRLENDNLRKQLSEARQILPIGQVRI